MVKIAEILMTYNDEGAAGDLQVQLQLLFHDTQYLTISI